MMDDERHNKGSGPEISKHMACVLNSKAILSGTPLKKLLCLLKLINSQIISALCSEMMWFMSRIYRLVIILLIRLFQYLYCSLPLSVIFIHVLRVSSSWEGIIDVTVTGRSPLRAPTNESSSRKRVLIWIMCPSLRSIKTVVLWRA